MKDKNGKPLTGGVVCAYSELPFSDYADSIGIMNGETFVPLIFRAAERSMVTREISFNESIETAVPLKYHSIKEDKVMDLEIIKDSLGGDDLRELFCSHFHSWKG